MLVPPVFLNHPGNWRNRKNVVFISMETSLLKLGCQVQRIIKPHAINIRGINCQYSSDVCQVCKHGGLRVQVRIRPTSDLFVCLCASIPQLSCFCASVREAYASMTECVRMRLPLLPLMTHNSQQHEQHSVAFTLLSEAHLINPMSNLCVFVLWL